MRVPSREENDHTAHKIGQGEPVDAEKEGKVAVEAG